MSLNEKNSYRLGLDHSVAKSAAFIVNQKNEPQECLYVSMTLKREKKINIYGLRIQRFKYVKKSASDIKDDRLRYETLLIEDTTIPLSEEKIDTSKRSHLISEKIIDFVKNFESNYSVLSEVRLEGYSYGSVGSLLDIAESTGILKNKLFQLGHTKIELIPPTSLKTWITEYGHASKELVASQMSSKMGIDFGNDDINDAFLLCVCPIFVKLKKVKKPKKKKIEAFQENIKKGPVAILETSNLFKKKAG